MTNNEILESINDIDSVVLESEMNVYNAIINECIKTQMILENYQGTNFDSFNESIVMESDNKTGTSITATKANVFKKLWGVIKSVIKWIWNQLKNFARFIKNIFKKNIKSGDQIADECGCNPDPNNKGDKIKVEIPADNDSTIKPPSNVIMNAFNDVSIKFNKDHTVSFIIIAEINQFDIFNPTRIPIMMNKNIFTPSNSKGNGLVNDGGVLAMIMLTNDDMWNRLKTVFTSFFNFINKNGDRNKSELKKIYEDFTDFSNDYKKMSSDWKTLSKWSFNINKLNEMQKDLNAILSMMDEVDAKNVTDDTKNDKIFEMKRDHIFEVDNRADRMLVNLTNIMTALQLSINSIGCYLKEPYLINRKYKNTISSPDVLAKFVNKCIASGMPPKYIMANSYLISDNKLIGKGSKRKPVWGQSRVIFFPSFENEYVYKIALSGVGITSNKNEVRCTELFKPYPKLNKLIAPIVKSYNGDEYESVIVQQIRATGKKPGDDDVTAIRDLLSDLRMEYDLEFVIGDLHDANFVIIPGGYKIFDYGDFRKY